MRRLVLVSLLPWHRIVLLVTFAALAIGAIGSLRAPVRPRVLAEDAALSILSGDPRGLANFLLDDELRAYGMTRSDAERLVREYIGPITEGIDQSGDTFFQGGSGIQFVMVPIKSKAGSLVRVPVAVYMTEDGPKLWLAGVLFSAWEFRDGYNGMKGAGDRGAWIMRDGERLKALGMPGVYDYRDGRVHPWDEYIPRGT